MTKDELRKELISVLEQGVKHKRKCLELEAKLKAADEVIELFDYETDQLKYHEALEHYKSLK